MGTPMQRHVGLAALHQLLCQIQQMLCQHATPDISCD
jgi:hypothetical protein